MGGIISQVNQKVDVGTFIRTVAAKGVDPEKEVQGFGLAYVSDIVAFSGGYVLISLTAVCAGEQFTPTYGFWIEEDNLEIPRWYYQGAKDGISQDS